MLIHIHRGLRRELAGVLDRYDASQAPSLKKLCEHVLKKRIQVGEHCPVEDAAHTLQLYLRHREVWEAEILQNS
ncbi:hypothetical protein T484DRAFT_2260171 [Baffinella frigidus]|nr:hypothetical protein T484DRAFT_2260171 [Cryptophyta sp. CCMP2293]